MSTWTTSNRCDLAKDCSYKEKIVEPTVFLNNELWLVIRKLCAEVKLEWQMLLSGEIDGNSYKITGYYIPKQKVTYGSAEDWDNLGMEWYKTNKIIATIHSHGAMGVFFSGTDDTNNRNSPATCHIVVNNADDYLACVRGKLPCGMEAFLKCHVDVMVSDVVIDGFDKIEKPAHTVVDKFTTDAPVEDQLDMWAPGSVYLGNGKWGPPQQDQRPYMNNGYAGDVSTGYPTVDQINDAVESDEKYRKNKKRDEKRGQPWWNK